MLVCLPFSPDELDGVPDVFEYVVADAAITRDPDELTAAHGWVLPGVGAFPLAMRNLHELGLSKLILAAAAFPAAWWIVGRRAGEG